MGCLAQDILGPGGEVEADVSNGLTADHNAFAAVPAQQQSEPGGGQAVARGVAAAAADGYHWANPVYLQTAFVGRTQLLKLRQWRHPVRGWRRCESHGGVHVSGVVVRGPTKRGRRPLLVFGASNRVSRVRSELHVLPEGLKLGSNWQTQRSNCKRQLSTGSRNLL